MKCLLCQRYSWEIICKACFDGILLTPRCRIIGECVKVYSFYRYEDVALLMQSKYYLIGSRILTMLAKKAAQYFFSNIKDSLMYQNISLIGLDDYPYSVYSHVGVILRVFSKQSRGAFRAHYGALRAQNNVKYAGENLAFRQANPKGFVLTRNINTHHIVLVDDVVTTGTSLNEAIGVLAHFYIPFALVLCDAQ